MNYRNIKTGHIISEACYYRLPKEDNMKSKLMRVVKQFLKQKFSEIGEGLKTIGIATLAAVIIGGGIFALCLILGAIINLIPMIHKMTNWEKVKYWYDYIGPFEGMGMTLLIMLSFIGLIGYGFYKFINWLKENWEYAKYEIEMQDKRKSRVK